MKKERQSNFELMRIFSFLFIIAWHIILHGQIFSGLGEPYSFIEKFLEAVLIVHVNSLVFLTGYFSSEKKTVSSKKIFGILGEAWFYRIVIFIVMVFLSIAPLDKVQQFELLFPISLNEYWFINCYAVLYLLIPYLNKVIHRMTKKDYIHFLFLMILLLSILPFTTRERFIANNGYTIVNLVLIYFIGAYFKKYPIKEEPMFQQLSTKSWRWILFFLFFFVAGIRLSFHYLGLYMANTNSSFLAYFGNIIEVSLLNYSTPLVLLQTGIYCLFFESIKVKSKIINYVASTTLGIYLIHDHASFRYYMYEALNLHRYGASKKVLIVFIETILIIFIVSFVIESIRKLMVFTGRKIFHKKKTDE